MDRRNLSDQSGGRSGAPRAGEEWLAATNQAAGRTVAEQDALIDLGKPHQGAAPSLTFGHSGCQSCFG